MKIFIVANTSWCMYNFRLEVIQKLIELKHDVYLLSTKDNFSSKLSNIGVKFKYFDFDPHGKKILNEFILFMKIFLFFKKNKPDLVLNYTIKPVLYSGFACFLLNIKFINFITGIGNFLFKDILRTFLIMPFYRISIKKAKKVIFLNSSDLKNFLHKKLLKKDNSILFQYGEGVNLERFKSIPHEVNKNKFIFFHAGRLLRAKGLSDLVHAIRVLRLKYKNLFIDVAGNTDDGEEYISLKELRYWEKEGIIKYHGVSTNISKLFNKVDCLCLQSSYGEGFPRIIMEANAMGVPVIATKIPGIIDSVIDGYNGFLHSINNHNELVKCIEKFINLSPRSRKNMINNCKSFARKNYDINNVVKSYLDFIK